MSLFACPVWICFFLFFLPFKCAVSSPAQQGASVNSYLQATAVALNGTHSSLFFGSATQALTHSRADASLFRSMTGSHALFKQKALTHNQL